MRRVGLLGGTFDPPHVGHLVVAECARVLLGLEEVRLLVAGDPWMKSTVSDAEHRLELCRTAVARQPGLTVDDREVRRSGPTYTADTLRELADTEPDTDWVFLLGADAALDLPAWEGGDEAMRLAEFVVVTRPGHPLDARAPDPVARLRRLPVPEIAISSTELRDRYRDDAPTRYLVPPDVDDLVRGLGLYGTR